MRLQMDAKPIATYYLLRERHLTMYVAIGALANGSVIFARAFVSLPCSTRSMRPSPHRALVDILVTTKLWFKLTLRG